MYRAILISASLWFAWGVISGDEAIAADAKDVFEPRVFKNAGGETLPYRLLKPRAYDEKQRYPLVLFFHGAGERGTDNTRQLVHGMNDFARDENREKYPCFVVAPQCPEGKRWVEVDWAADKHEFQPTPSVTLKLVEELLAALEQEFRIDPARLYVTGLSMGGYATWDVVTRHPKKFAAAAPICGGGDEQQAAKLVDTPIWAFHGSQDTVVKPARSRNMIEAIKQAQGKPVYTEYAGVGHDSWGRAYQDPQLLAWMFAQQRKN
ncbi:MAG: prolyl oligopeptidase family serine peptidase [Planctomycetes bacterium]|nr:prolyl oligopeptidase family serine peptidase [Planctomycetota bacterium]